MSSDSYPPKSNPPRPMTVSEVREVARELQSWEGAQLQEIVIDGIKGEEPRSIRLGFFWTGGIRWIVFDYRVQAPLLLLFDGQDGVPMVPPKTAGKIRRPIELFLRSNHVGRRLRDVRLRVDDGRALDLVFDPLLDDEQVEQEVSIELKVYPHGRNIRAIAGAQSVAEFKPMAAAKESSSKASVAPAGRTKAFDSLEQPDRTRAEMAFEWIRFVKPEALQPKKRFEGAPDGEPLAGGVAAKAAGAKSPLEIKIEKKRKALEKVREEIASKEHSPAREIGEWLKANQSLDVPREWPAAWRDMIESNRSLAVNIERLFTSAKNQTRKLDGTRARANELDKEIETLMKKVSRGETREDARQSTHENLGGGSQVPKDLFKAADARGRKFQLADDLIVYLGKNAAENLAILRKAQPFDLWLHLRDRPGSHAILRRARGRNVTDAELIKAGIYVAEQTMKRRAIEMKGEAFDLLVVECRYVRPIKGDRLGRVHYTNDRVVRLSL